MASVKDIFIISDQDIEIYSWVVFAVMCQIINVFGIVTNIINIICFVKQGFEDSVNISLLALTVSDLGSLVTMIGTCVFVTPSVLRDAVAIDPMEVMYLTTALPHMSFTRVSGCITAMITVERCLCITSPLKVKSMLTQTRTTIITVCVFTAFFCTSMPVYAVNRLDQKFSPLRNMTVFGLVSTKNRGSVETILFTVNNIFIPLGTFMIIVASTAIISVKLRISVKWRAETITNAQIDKATIRSQRTSKMVAMVATLFIVCFIPVSVIMLVAIFVPELHYQGKYINISIIIAGIGYVMESINSSMNIFIYYSMSSKYRASFLKLWKNTQFFVDKTY